MPELFGPTLDDLIRCAEREVQFRERVYPRQVAAGRMTQRNADRELELMRAIAGQLRLDRARNSAVECSAHNADVAGSNPAGRTE